MRSIDGLLEGDRRPCEGVVRGREIAGQRLSPSRGEGLASRHEIAAHAEQEDHLHRDEDRHHDEHGHDDPTTPASRWCGLGYDEGLFLRRRFHVEAVPFACGGCSAVYCP